MLRSPSVAGDALAGQGRFLRLECGGFENAAVRRNIVSGFQCDDIAGHQLRAVNDDQLAGAEDLALCGAHRLQCFDRGLGLVLLIDAQNGIRDDDKEDDEHICFEPSLGDDAGHGGDDRGCEQHKDHRIFELFEETCRECRLRRIGEPVLTVLCETRFGLLLCQAGLGALQCIQHRFGGFQIMLHGSSPPQ